MRPPPSTLKTPSGFELSIWTVTMFEIVMLPALSVVFRRRSKVPFPSVPQVAVGFESPLPPTMTDQEFAPCGEDSKAHAPTPLPTPVGGSDWLPASSIVPERTALSLGAVSALTGAVLSIPMPTPYFVDALPAAS